MDRASGRRLPRAHRRLPGPAHVPDAAGAAHRHLHLGERQAHRLLEHPVAPLLPVLHRARVRAAHGRCARDQDLRGRRLRREAGAHRAGVRRSRAGQARPDGRSRCSTTGPRCSLTIGGATPNGWRSRPAWTSEGKILAVKANFMMDGGAYTSLGIATAYYAGAMLTLTYEFDNYRFDMYRVYTNLPACGAQRGHGAPQPRYAFESPPGQRRPGPGPGPHRDPAAQRPPAEHRDPQRLPGELLRDGGLPAEGPRALGLGREDAAICRPAGASAWPRAASSRAPATPSTAPTCPMPRP